MRIFLVGEAAEHEADLRSGLEAEHEIVPLPREAATDAAYDDRLRPDDVVVSLRFRRPLGAVPPFRLLQVPGAGLDGIDLDALSPATSVANVFEHEIPIAEYVLARLLEWEIRASAMAAEFSPTAWPEQYRRRIPHGEVHGRTLGLLGYGRIGRAIAVRAAAFGVRVVALDDAAASDGSATVLPTGRLPSVLGELDYLVVACPLTPTTTGLVDATALALLPRHAVLVNVSRAEVVDEDALYEALAEHRIGGAVLDVWYRYPVDAQDRPPPARRPFWDLPHAWCTPHSCAWTRELSRRRYRVVADNVDALAAGRPLQNLVGGPRRP